MSGRGTKSSPEVGRFSQDIRDGVALSFVPGLKLAVLREAVERFGSAPAAFREGPHHAHRESARRDADNALSRWGARDASVMLLGEPSYPASLLELPQAPFVLYALGSTTLLERRMVGIVGTRHSSPSGDRIAYEMAALLARAGVVVVSGMAFGIDAAAHRGALDAGGGTIAVLGGGADVPYPPRHANLHERIRGAGLVVSEAAPGSRPGKGAFPRRNRIIAGLSETLVVVEAGDRSGALITSRYALELGRNVAAVPGAIDSPRHVGSNRLLFEGASFISRVEDVLSIARVEPTRPEPTAPDANDDQVDVAHRLILESLRTGASDVEDLGRSTRLPPRDFASALATLELSGRIHVSPTGVVSSSSSFVV